MWWHDVADVADEVPNVIDEVESIDDDIVDEMVDNMMNDIPTTEMITPTTTTSADGDEYDSYTHEDINIELLETVKTFMGDAAEKLGLDISKEDWLSSLWYDPSTDDYAETGTTTENENEITLVNMLT